LRAFRPLTYKTGWCESLLYVLACSHWPPIIKRLKIHRDPCILVRWCKWAQVGTSGSWAGGHQIFNFRFRKHIIKLVTYCCSSMLGLANSDLRLKNKSKLMENHAMTHLHKWALPTCKWASGQMGTKFLTFATSEMLSCKLHIVVPLC